MSGSAPALELVVGSDMGVIGMEHQSASPPDCKTRMQALQRGIAHA